MRGVLVAALALALAALVTDSQAQQRTFYDSRGNIVGRSSTNSSGTTTWTVWRAIYDASGKVMGSMTTDSSGTTTYYDASGRVASREVPIRRTGLYNGMICGFAGPCWNPSEKFGGRP